VLSKTDLNLLSFKDHGKSQHSMERMLPVQRMLIFFREAKYLHESAISSLVITPYKEI
jgi:hypothetical protein